MKSFSLILSIATLTGTLMATALPSRACIFSDRMNSTSPSITGDSSGTSGNSISFKPNKFGVAGLAVLGLVGGGLLLKAQLGKRSEVGADASEAEEAELAAAPKAASVFPIDVPAAALADHDRIKAGIQ